ncbi:MAG: dihydrofolate reductase [Oscillospiraceae bacterium]|nr:dihydrofolate reductase [Oscillospiraceae bacterium]
MIKIVAAIGKNRELGQNNSLIWHLPTDMKLFRAETMGQTVVMGRLTYLSIGKPLPKRRNIVISRDKSLRIDGVEIAGSLEEALSLCENNCCIIGGAQVYSQAIKIADELVLTEIDAKCPEADAFFPEFDKTKYQAEISAEGKDDGVGFRQVRYKRIF